MAKCAVYSGKIGNLTTGRQSWGTLNVGDESISTGNTPSTPVPDTVSTVRAVGTFSNALFRLSSNATTAPSTFNFTIGQVNQTQSFAIPTGQSGEFEDITHSDAVVAGNNPAIGITSGSGGTLTTTVIGCCFSAVVGTSCWLGGFNITTGINGAQKYARFPNPSAGSASLTADMQYQFPVAGTLKYGNAGINGPSSATGTSTYASTINGLTGNISVSIPGPSAQGQYEDIAHSDAVAVGTLVNTQNSTAATGNASGLFLIVLETMDGSMVTAVQPGSGQNGGFSYAANSLSYEPLNGVLQGTATEGNVKTKAGVPCTLSASWAYVFSNANTGTSTVELRKGGIDVNASVPITSGATGLIQDVSGSNDPLLATDEIDWEVAPSASGAAVLLSTIAAKITGLNPVGPTTGRAVVV